MAEREEKPREEKPRDSDAGDGGRGRGGKPGAGKPRTGGKPEPKSGRKGPDGKETPQEWVADHGLESAAAVATLIILWLAWHNRHSSSSAVTSSGGVIPVSGGTYAGGGGGGGSGFYPGGYGYGGGYATGQAAAATGGTSPTGPIPSPSAGLLQLVDSHNHNAAPPTPSGLRAVWDRYAGSPSGSGPGAWIYQTGPGVAAPAAAGTSFVRQTSKAGVTSYVPVK